MRVLPFVLLAACGWNHLPDQDSVFLEQRLWDPAGALPTVDGLYAPLTHSGGLALIKQQGEPQRVDIGEGRLTRLTLSPDQRTVVGFVERLRCDTDDKKEARKVKTPEDCDADDLIVETEIDVVRQGKVIGELELAGQFNAIAYSDDGQYAIAWLDFDDDPDLTGVIDLTSVAVIDLFDAKTEVLSVGFAADNVLFSYDTDDDGEPVARRAVVLSDNSVAVLDLAGDTPLLEVNFPLTLDPDKSLTPVGVDLTPDGQYALITVEGAADLYALDLFDHAVNIVELADAPSAMLVNDNVDRTVIVTARSPVVDVIEHEFFDITSWDLDEPMSRIAQFDEFAVLYDPNGNKDVYRLGLDDGDLVEMRLRNPITQMHIAPTGEFGLALTRPDNGFGDIVSNRPGMEILDMTRDDDGDIVGKTRPFLLEGNGLGVAWSAPAKGGLHALVLQEGVNYLHLLDMYTGNPQQIELSAPPVAIGTMPDGTFYITHDAGLGLVSFYDPSKAPERAITEVAGFATLGIGDSIELITEEAE